MKKICGFIGVVVAFAMFTVLSVTSFAASTDILKGVPEIDGKVDEIYSQTLAIPIGEGTGGAGFYSTGDSPETDVTGTVYLLWDDKYLYVCSDVKDGDVLSAGDEYINAEINPWMNDATEYWVDLNAGVKTKISVDAFGKKVFGNNETDFDFANVAKAATQSSGGYITEMAIPLPVPVAEGDEIGFKIQVNDYAADGTVVALAANYGEGNQEVVFYKLGAAVVMPEPEPEPEVSEENPETSDNMGIYSIISIAVSLGVMVLLSIKKRING